MNFGFVLISCCCLIISPYSAASLEDQYIGCYQDGDLSDEIIIASMKVSTCIEHCKSRQKTYAGAQNGSKCFCGDSYGKYDTITKCNVLCSGDSTYYCGGVVQNSVYAVCPISLYGPSCDKECHCKNRMPCNIRNGSCLNGCADGWTGKDCNTTTSLAHLSHHGCYSNNIAYLTFILSGALTNNFMTIQWCMDECRAKYPQKTFLYAGLQDSYKCTCGYSNYTGAGVSDKCGKNCMFPDCACAGNTRLKKCGGPGANDVFSVCQFGYFGQSCSQQCHCANEANCTMETGNCGSSGCAPGWSGSACNVRKCSDNNGDCQGDQGVCATESLGPGAQHVVARCRCKKGYNRAMEHETCTDVDECLPGMDNECDNTTGVCKNSVGDYVCECLEGFTNIKSNTTCEVTTAAMSTTMESTSAEGSERAVLTSGLSLGVGANVLLGVGALVLLLVVIITLKIFIAKRKRKPSTVILRDQGNSDLMSKSSTPTVGGYSVSAAYESTKNTDTDGTFPIYTDLMMTPSTTTDGNMIGTTFGNSPYESINNAYGDGTFPNYTQLVTTPSTVTDGNMIGTTLGNLPYESINNADVSGTFPNYTQLVTTPSTVSDGNMIGTTLGNSPYESINNTDVDGTFPNYTQLVTTPSTTTYSNITGTTLRNAVQ